MGKIGGNRNFGYGKQLAFAGKQALKDRFVEGHFSSVATHSERWSQFVEWAKGQDIKDARDICRHDIEAYGKDLRGQVVEGEMSVAYAQNLISTVNVVLSQMRGDNQMWASPSEMVGARSTVRSEAPIWMERVSAEGVQARLMAKGESAVAAMVGLARDLGLRFRETSLIDVAAAYREAKRTGKVTISEGVKGGNNTRVVPIVTHTQFDTLRRAAAVQGGRRSLIVDGKDYRAWRSHAYHAFYRVGGKHFHDLRAAYACDRYQALTGHLAPVLRGVNDSRPSKAIDLGARMVISRELGHHRIDVVSEYVGGRR